MKHRVLIAPLTAALLFSTAPQAAACWSATTKERKLAHMTNTARSNNDRGRLHYSEALSKAARVHSRRMGRRNYLFHNTLSSFEGLIGGSWTRIGENVGVGERIRQIHRAFLRSSAHRANILGDWSKVGTGVVRKGGRLWVTVMFAAGGSVRAKVGAPTC